MKRTLLCVLVIGLCLPPRLAAQATVALSPQDPLQSDIDRIVASGLVRSVVVGSRGHSRRDIAWLVRAALQSQPERPVSASTQRSLERLRAAFADDIRALDGGEPARSRPIDAWTAQTLGLDSPTRAIPNDNTGSVEADINPLRNGRSGRTLGNGLNAAIETNHSFRLNPATIVRASPRLSIGRQPGASNPDSYEEFTFTELSATALVRNLRIEFGRQSWVWGQGMDGGLIASTSGKPLDMVRVYNELPFRAPGILRYLGDLRGVMQLADLGANQRFPHSKVFAYRLSGRMTSHFELGSYVVAEYGGHGAPQATFLDYVIDFIPPLKYSIPNKNDSQFSNKFTGVELRFFIPGLSGMQAYLETGFEDADPRRWKSTFWEDGGHIAGVSFSDLGPEGAISAAAEFHHTGLRFYKHGPFRTGLTFERTLFGDPLGNQGDGGYLRLRWDRGLASAFQLDGAIERRRGDFWQTVSTTPDDSDFHFEVIQGFPAEWRHRLGASWRVTQAHRVATLEATVERERNVAFVDGKRRTNLLVGLTLGSR